MRGIRKGKWYTAPLRYPYDTVVNRGGTVGRVCTGISKGIFGDYKIVKVNTASDLLQAVIDYRGDTWGMEVYAHGSKNGDIAMTHGRNKVSQSNLSYAVGFNRYKLAKINMNQCYSAYAGPPGTPDWGTVWKSLTEDFNGYEGINALGLDVIITPHDYNTPGSPAAKHHGRNFDW